MACLISENTVLGIDGCRAGWIAIAIGPERKLTPILLETTEPLFECLQRAPLTFIDMPIGLADSEASRPCDRLLRQALGPRFRSSVFNPPVRSAVYAQSYLEACDRNAAATGKKISKQSWNITSKIRQLDELLLAYPELRGTVLESHPELLFARLNGDRELLHKKKTTEGRMERLEILARFWPGVEAGYEEVRSQFLKKQMADDDIVDAMGLAIGAWLARDSGVSRLPRRGDGVVDVDAKGVPMAIHFFRPV